MPSLVGSEMCIRDRCNYGKRYRGKYFLSRQGVLNPPGRCILQVYNTDSIVCEGKCHNLSLNVCVLVSDKIHVRSCCHIPIPCLHGSAIWIACNNSYIPYSPGCARIGI